MTQQTENVYKVFTDGGSRGNPGPAAFAYVIYDPNSGLVHESKQYIGPATNNQAEYQGLVAALRYIQAIDLIDGASVVCYSDSQLMVRQINGQYRMKNEELKQWLDEIQMLRSRMSFPITFVDIRRDQNKYADRLVNEALDEVTHG